SKKKFSENQIVQKTIAIPGFLTTAYWLLKIYCPAAQTKVITNEKIINAVLNNEVDAGLIIDGNQMTYAKNGLSKIIDLGLWWYERTKLPLPLGGNILRKDVGSQITENITEIFRESIQYALENRHEAVRYAMRFAQDMSQEEALKFIGR